MVLKDFAFPDFKDGDARTKSLNGYANPPIRSRPGEFQIWEIGNLGADAIFDLKLEGHTFWVLERDGNLLLKPVQQRPSVSAARRAHHRRGPGFRPGPGRYALRSLNVDTGPAGRSRTRTSRSAPSSSAAQPAGGGAAILARLREGPADTASIQPNPNQLRKRQDQPHPLRRLLRDRQRQHLLHQRQDLQREPGRHDRPAGRDGALDRAQLLRRDARLPPAPDRVPGRQVLGHAGPDRGPGHARRDQHPLCQERQARRGRADHPLHQPDHGRRVRLPLPHRRPRGRRHDGQHLGAAEEDPGRGRLGPDDPAGRPGAAVTLAGGPGRRGRAGAAGRAQRQHLPAEAGGGAPSRSSGRRCRQLSRRRLEPDRSRRGTGRPPAGRSIPAAGAATPVPPPAPRRSRQYSQRKAMPLVLRAAERAQRAPARPAAAPPAGLPTALPTA